MSTFDSTMATIFVAGLCAAILLQSLTFWMLVKLKEFTSAIQHSVNSDREAMLAKIEALQLVILTGARDNATMVERERAHERKATP
jgi:hypothetical protein